MWKLRKLESGDPLIVSMTGLRLGNSVLFLGCRDPRAIAQLALRPGLSGRACAVDEERGRIEAASQAAQLEGALLETEIAPLHNLPFAPESFDAVVAVKLLRTLDAGLRGGVFGEAFRVVRPGGRCVTVEEGGSRRFAGLVTSAPPFAADEIEQVLRDAAFRGVRTLADRQGLLFVEGAKPK